MIMAAVDWFSKMACFIFYRTTTDEHHVAQLFFKAVVKLHDVPLSIVSDRIGARSFWQLFRQRYDGGLGQSCGFPPLHIRRQAARQRLSTNP